MERFSMNKSAPVSRNNGEESLVPAEARSADQSSPVLAFTPLAPRGRAPGLIVRTQLRAGKTHKGGIMW
jgi:hypothetical protein